jgi:hypothetical protein
MIVRLLLFGLLLGFAPGQQIISVTCWGFGGPSCTEHLFAVYQGYLNCACAAQCSNSNNIGATYTITWQCNYMHTGSIHGKSYGTKVRVDGDIMNVATHMYLGAGHEEQRCDGEIDGRDFFEPWA